ncbi:MAG: AAA family ATPase [Bdellovibrio sp.]|nr:AAA family ATPase [Bdellovibrio sp.]
MAKKFIGRIKEQALLTDFIERPGSRIAVIYGRRRIGKSELIHTVCLNRRTFYFEGLENQPKKNQISNFMLQLPRQNATEQNGVKSKKSTSWPTSWKEAFLELLPYLSYLKESSVIVLDEFQWMANYRSDAVSDLKMVWDQYLSKTGCKLILCGSLASYMLKKVIRSTALYGRTELLISLDELKLSEAKDFFENRSTNELFEAFLLFGGVPLYLELISQEPSVVLGIEKLAFSPAGYFVDEFNRIFESHFVKNRTYKQIVQTLMQYPYGIFRHDLAKKLNQSNSGTFSDLLYDLESTGFIKGWRPLDKKSNSKILKYMLSDKYSLFYHVFISPNIAKILEGNKNIYSRLRNSPSFNSWIGRSFELTCTKHSLEISKILGFSGIDYSSGPYFRAKTKAQKGVQFDLVFDRADHVITVCEMKWTENPPGVEVIESVQKKIAVSPDIFANKTVQKILITRMEPSKELIRSGYFYRIIKASELLISLAVLSLLRTFRF